MSSLSFIPTPTPLQTLQEGGRCDYLKWPERAPQLLEEKCNSVVARDPKGEAGGGRGCRAADVRPCAVTPSSSFVEEVVLLFHKDPPTNR